MNRYAKVGINEPAGGLVVQSSKHIVSSLILHTLILESKFKLADDLFVLEFVDVGAPSVRHRVERVIKLVLVKSVIGLLNLSWFLLLSILIGSGSVIVVTVTVFVVHLLHCWFVHGVVFKVFLDDSLHVI